jgi:hypothetical protein
MMFYRIEARERWEANVALVHGDDVVRGGPVIPRFFPQWSRDEITWRTYTNLGMCRDGFETPESAERFLERKNPRYREQYKGVHQGERMEIEL